MIVLLYGVRTGIGLLNGAEVGLGYYMVSEVGLDCYMVRCWFCLFSLARIDHTMSVCQI